MMPCGTGGRSTVPVVVFYDGNPHTAGSFPLLFMDSASEIELHYAYENAKPRKRIADPVEEFHENVRVLRTTS